MPRNRDADAASIVKAMELLPCQRFALAEFLLESADEMVDPEAERAWKPPGTAIKDTPICLLSEPGL